VRRTKEEAEETRRAILVAAERLFAKNGVTKVSLEQIAASLGLTRGAVRWHFRDKRGLLFALLDSEGLPLHELAGHLEIDQELDPFDELIDVTARLLGDLQSDPKRQRLMKQLVNFVDVEAPEQRRAFDHKIRAAVRTIFELAAKRRALSPHWRPDNAALAFCAMVSGLVSEWLRGGAHFNLHPEVVDILSTFVDSLRAGRRTGRR
jgi:TetR/AcrR family acrAB operon transcriptional repressor